MKKIKGIRALIFDYGGTLDTRGRHWSHILWEGFVAAGVPIDKETFLDAYVQAERTLARTPIIAPEDNFHALLLKKADIETKAVCDSGRWEVNEPVRRKAAECIAAYGYGYAQRETERSRRVLEQLQPHFGMVLVSNFYGNIHTILKDFKLDVFQAVIESAVVGVRKPDPAIYRLGVQATGVRAEETVVVGDSLSKDMLPAKAVGCHTVWLKGEGWGAEPEDGSCADVTIADLEELPRLLL